MWGARQVAPNMPSAASAGPTTSSVTSAGPLPTWLKRSPHRSVRVVSSKRTWASHPWGTCGVQIWRSRLPPMSRTSSSPRTRGGRSHMSFSDTSQPRPLKTTSLPGAAVSHAFMAPHSSPSTWPKLIQRREAGGRTVATASLTRGKSIRMPVWNSSGSSPTTRNWLKVNPSGLTSGIHVEIR